MEDGDIDAWANSIQVKLPKLKAQNSSIIITIPRVPERFRKGENDTYDPEVISFGPYHHGKPRLQAMEKYKWSYLEAILARKSEARKSEIQLKHYIHTLKEMEEETRKCYPDHFDNIGSKEFVEMILIDACFIVEYILRGLELVKDKVDSNIMVVLLESDMLKLENQLPFFVLETIFAHSFTPSHAREQSSCPSSFADLAISYFKWVSDKELELPIPAEPIHHLLHLYHSFCLYTPEVQGENLHTSISIDEGIPIEKDWSIMIPSVAVLQEAGIKFRRRETDQGSNLDVSFNDGEMVIPQLIVTSSTKSELRNLIAFEQFYPDKESKFYKSYTAYGIFMNDIINTPEDIALLCDEDIIRHSLGSNKDVAKFFNNISNGAVLGRTNYLNELYKNVDVYRKVRCHRWRANLMHNYFNTPWAVVSVVAGSILLLLTLLQTIFSVYSAF